jgi:hypothetical protein
MVTRQLGMVTILIALPALPWSPWLMSLTRATPWSPWLMSLAGDDSEQPTCARALAPGRASTGRRCAGSVNANECS